MTQNIERLKEIITLAKKLGWIFPDVHDPRSYPLMQLSEVEKCMLSMSDDKELQRIRVWANGSDDEVNERSDKCGIDGNGDHQWRYNDKGRQCAYCTKRQIIKGDWEDVKD